VCRVALACGIKIGCALDSLDSVLRKVEVRAAEHFDALNGKCDRGEMPAMTARTAVTSEHFNAS
jgi:hypothetical protein